MNVHGLNQPVRALGPAGPGGEELHVPPAVVWGSWGRQTERTKPAFRYTLQSLSTGRWYELVSFE